MRCKKEVLNSIMIIKEINEAWTIKRRDKDVRPLHFFTKMLKSDGDYWAFSFRFLSKVLTNSCVIYTFGGKFYILIHPCFTDPVRPPTHWKNRPKKSSPVEKIIGFGLTAQ